MSDGKVKLVLASASPRRLALLDQAGLMPDVLNPVDLEEAQGKRETPRALSLRLAIEKAKAALDAPRVKALNAPTFILAADTVVCVGRRVIGKPKSIEEAADSLRLLSGRSHKVFTSICLITPSGSSKSRVCETKVRFKRLSREDIESYLACDEWRGKAGAYAIQGRAAAFVRYLTGSHSAVVGLPLYETVSLLQGTGYPVYFTWMNARPE